MVRVATLYALLEGLSFDEKCGVLGVVPRQSGLCVATAASPGGAMVASRNMSHVDAHAPAVTFRSPMHDQDVILARKLQEKYEVVTQTDAEVANYAELTASVSDVKKSEKPAARACPTAPPRSTEMSAALSSRLLGNPFCRRRHTREHRCHSFPVAP